MNFYSSIAPYYDLIFPYDELQIKFLEALLGPEEKSNANKHEILTKQSRSFLDIGCGTGTILSALSDRFKRLVGIDLDEELLSLAAKKMYPGEVANVELLLEDMMEMKTLFREDSFSFITCLGNTIPHLTGSGQISNFFRNVYEILDADGIFVFQIINYDRILDDNIQMLPQINRDDIVFERYYSEIKPNGFINFESVLINKTDNLTMKNNVELFPIRKNQIVDYLKSTGFTSYQFFGDYSGKLYSNDSFLLIGICNK